MPPSGCKRKSVGRSSSDQAGSRSRVKIPTFHMQRLNVHSSKYEIVLGIEGTGMCQPSSLIRAKQVTRHGARKVYLLLPWKSLFRGE